MHRRSRPPPAGSHRIFRSKGQRGSLSATTWQRARRLLRRARLADIASHPEDRASSPARSTIGYVRIGCPFRCSVGSAWPSVTTMHGRLDLPGLSEVLRQFPRASFVSISDHKRLPLPEANWTATIPHGLPSNSFRPSFDQGSYLAFLGRLTAKRAPRTPSASRAGTASPRR